jgi:hypothetical protein
MMILAKPEKPKKKITQRQTATFDFNWVSKKVAIETFLAWVKETTPTGAKDVTLELIEDWDYYGNDCVTSLELAWDEVIDNPNYEKEMKKYQKKLKAWKEQ